MVDVDGHVTMYTKMVHYVGNHLNCLVFLSLLVALHSSRSHAFKNVMLYIFVNWTIELNSVEYLKFVVSFLEITYQWNWKICTYIERYINNTILYWLSSFTFCKYFWWFNKPIYYGIFCELFSSVLIFLFVKFTWNSSDVKNFD